MTNRIESYNFILSTPILWVLILFFYISSGSMLNTEGNLILSLFTHILVLLLPITSVLLSENYLSIGKNRWQLPSLVLLLLLFDTEAHIGFKSLISAIVVVISLVATSVIKHRQSTIFITCFTISIAVTFEPIISLFLPLIIVYLFVGKPISIKDFFLTLTAFVLPLMFKISYLWIFDKNFLDFFRYFFSTLSNYGGELFRLKTPAGYFYNLVFLLLVLTSVFHTIKSIKRYKIAKALILHRFIALIIYTGLIYFIYPKQHQLFWVIISLPLSAIIIDSVPEKGEKNRVTIIATIFFIVAIIARLTVVFR